MNNLLFKFFFSLFTCVGGMRRVAHKRLDLFPKIQLLEALYALLYSSLGLCKLAVDALPR
jgi:hypothetical protein